MINDGGPAFPTDRTGQNSGMSLRDYFAVHLPEPTDADIKHVSEMEKMANPHNDSYKPKRRSWREIKAALRYQHADDLLEAREEGRLVKRAGGGGEPK